MSVFGRRGPPRAIECERERALLQSFRLKGRQSKKHSKHKLWQPFKIWKWKLENYFKHTGNYEPHTLFGSAFMNICDRPDVHGKENPAFCRMFPMQMRISRVVGCLAHQLLMKPWEMYSKHLKVKVEHLSHYRAKGELEKPFNTDDSKFSYMINLNKVPKHT